MNIPAAVALLGLLVFLAHALDGVFTRTRIPDVLFLLGLGLLLGPVSGLVKPEQLGAVGPVFTALTLVVILFEGGLGLDLRVLTRSLAGATGLTVWNFIATLLVVMPLGRALLGLSWLQAATLGACLGGTSSAVVIPMVQRLRIGQESRAVLALESALSDVLVIVVALGLMNAQARGELHIGPLLGGMAASFLLAALMGAAAGLAWSLALERVRGLRNSILTTPAWVFIVYGLAELLGYSGAIAALVMGITLGNLDAVPRVFTRLLRRSSWTLGRLGDTDREVFSELVFLMKTFLFVFVGVSMQLHRLPLVLAGLAFTAGIFLLRVPAVHLSLSPRSFSPFDAAVGGAMGAKGLAAAVVATLPLQMGLPNGMDIKLTVFAVVLFSILLTSVLVFFLERGWMAPFVRILYARYNGRREDHSPTS